MLMQLLVQRFGLRIHGSDLVRDTGYTLRLGADASNEYEQCAQQKALHGESECE
jgi:hypothetical protein